MSQTVGKLSVLLSANASGLDAGLDKASLKMNAFGGGGSASFGKLAGAAAVAGAALGVVTKVFDAGAAAAGKLVDAIGSAGGELAGLARDAVKAGVEFEDAMLKIQGKGDFAADSMRELNDVVRQLGVTTGKGATDVAAGMQQLAAAGLKPGEIAQAIRPLLAVSAAEGLELAEASEILTRARAGMNLTFNDIGRIADVLVKASAETTSGVRDLGEALKYAAGPAALAGIELEDLAASLALMQEAGAATSMAGTEFAAMFSGFLVKTDEAKKATRELGVQFYDAAGRLKPFASMVDELNLKLGGLSDFERDRLLDAIFTDRAARGVKQLMLAGGGRMREMADTLRASGGAAQRMADIMESGVGGAFRRVSAVAQELKITFFEAVAGPLRQAADEALRLGQLAAPALKEGFAAAVRVATAAANDLWRALGGPEGGVGALFDEKAFRAVEGFFANLEVNAAQFFRWLEETWRDVAGLLAAELVRAFTLASEQIVKYHYATVKKAAFASPAGAVGMLGLLLGPKQNRDIDSLVKSIDREELNRRWQGVFDKLRFRVGVEAVLTTGDIRPRLRVGDPFAAQGAPVKGAPLGQEVGRAVGASLAAGLEKGSVEAVSAVNRWRVQSGRMRKEDEQLLLQKRQAAGIEEGVRVQRDIARKLNFKVV